MCVELVLSGVCASPTDCQYISECSTDVLKCCLLSNLPWCTNDVLSRVYIYSTGKLYVAYIFGARTDPVTKTCNVCDRVFLM